MAQQKESPAPAAPAPEEPQASGAPTPETEEWIYTFQSATGEVVKVERVDPGSGKREEISAEDYNALAASAMDASAQLEMSAAAGQGFNQMGFEAGYYQGLADYEAGLMQASAYGGMSAEEAAYYQGMADYEALLGQSQQGMSAEEAAYHQGMADYAAALGLG
jgi:hypothetical protein